MSMIKVKHWAAVVLTYPLALVVCVVLVPVFAGVAADMMASQVDENEDFVGISTGL